MRSHDPSDNNDIVQSRKEKGYGICSPYTLRDWNICPKVMSCIKPSCELRVHTANLFRKFRTYVHKDGAEIRVDMNGLHHNSEEGERTRRRGGFLLPTPQEELCKYKVFSDR